MFVNERISCDRYLLSVFKNNKKKVTVWFWMGDIYLQTLFLTCSAHVTVDYLKEVLGKVRIILDKICKIVICTCSAEKERFQMGKLRLVYSAIMKDVRKKGWIFICSQDHLLEFIKMWVPMVPWQRLLSICQFILRGKFLFTFQKSISLGLIIKKKSSTHELRVKISRSSKTWKIQLC